MLRFKKWILAILVFALPIAADPVVLHYQPDQPVIQRSRISVELSQKTDRRSLNSTGYQEMEAQIKLIPSQDEPPFQLTLILNRLRVGFEEGGRAVSFDSASPENSLIFHQLAGIIGDPIQLTVGENLQIETGSANYQRLIKHLKPLNGFTVNRLFSEMFQQMFALADKELKVNQSYTRELKLGADAHIPVTLTYRIVEITPDEVRATVEGTVAEASFQLADGVLGSYPTSPTVRATGAITGKAVWSRANALIYRTKISHLYTGVIVDGSDERPFQLRMEHTDSGKLDPISK